MRFWAGFGVDMLTMGTIGSASAYDLGLEMPV